MQAAPSLPPPWTGEGGEQSEQGEGSGPPASASRNRAPLANEDQKAAGSGRLGHETPQKASTPIGDGERLE